MTRENKDNRELLKWIDESRSHVLGCLDIFELATAALRLVNSLLKREQSGRSGLLSKTLL